MNNLIMPTNYTYVYVCDECGEKERETVSASSQTYRLKRKLFVKKCKKCRGKMRLLFDPELICY